jgi:hypothetical protein
MDSNHHSDKGYGYNKPFSYQPYHSYHNHIDSDYRYNEYGGHHEILRLAGKIWYNKRLRVLFLFFGILIVLAGIALLIALWPMISKLLGYVSQNGLQGVLTEISGFLDKVWKGSSN